MSPTTRHYLERSLERAEECRKVADLPEGGYSYAYGYLKQAVRSLLEADLSSAQTAPTYETLGAEVSEE